MSSTTYSISCFHGSSFIPVVFPLKTSILHHYWCVSIFDIVSSMTSSTIYFFIVCEIFKFFSLKYKKSYLL